MIHDVVELREGLTKGERYKMKLWCKDGHQFNSSVNNYINGGIGCRTCAGNIPWSERIPELIDEIGKRGDTLIMNIKDLEAGLLAQGKKFKMKLKCKHGHQFNPSLDHYMNRKHGCPTCSGKVPWSERIPEIIDEIGKRGDTLIMNIKDLEASLLAQAQNFKMKLRCKHGHEFTPTVNHYMNRKHGCPTCSGKVPWSERIPELIDKIGKRGDTLIMNIKDLEAGLLAQGKKFKMKLLCKDGHQFNSSVNNYMNHRHGCPECSMMRSEKTMVEIIEELFGDKVGKKATPNFIRNPDTGRNLELDYYIESSRIAFEYNGIQHYEFSPFYHRNGEQDLQMQLRHDELKRRACDSEGITLVTIDGREYSYQNREAMKNYIRTALNNFFCID